MIRAALFTLSTTIVALTASQTAHAEERPRAAPFQKLLDCRSLTDSAQRLACYDAQVDTLESAEQKKEIVIVDKEQVREARRGLFGFTLPSLKIFGGGKDAPEEEELKEIEATIRGTGRTPDGGWTFTLEDGARWYQIDNNIVARSPKAGSKVKIKRAALGSYFASIDGQPGIRVKRSN